MKNVASWNNLALKGAFKWVTIGRKVLMESIKTLISQSILGSYHQSQSSDTRVWSLRNSRNKLIFCSDTVETSWLRYNSFIPWGFSFLYWLIKVLEWCHQYFDIELTKLEIWHEKKLITNVLDICTMQ